jgi:hypothetical protein
MAKINKNEIELKSNNNSLCPLIKSFGECIDANNCSYRHKLNIDEDKVKLLNDNFPIPSEGFVKVFIKLIQTILNKHS